ncbi:hypothetical protein [Ruminococcus sp.]|uniref:hypothetical protein n=1 Tax=Ruminococcus sp. TaxID=41978 RepID=UPI002E78F2C3|nr:hypothetical protein [Ruminococcus sp.]MEE1262261.1 hypothetical protein [Ruminococcus sp.]
MNDKQNARIVYADIINLPHFQSQKRPHMSLYDRAAQFAPFAALTGFDDIPIGIGFDFRAVYEDVFAADFLLNNQRVVAIDKGVVFCYYIVI